MYDAIVIGAGHNGLTCAAYLARAGRRVLVLESGPTVGGMCRTDETVPEAPGFQMSTCALDCLLTNIPRSVVDELQLSTYGLRFVWPDPWGSYVNPEGASIALWRNPGRTVAEIARFSRRDAERFERLERILGDVFWMGAPYFQDHPTRPGARTITEMLTRAVKGRRSLRPALRIMMSSPDQIIEEWFEREEVKACLGSLASWSQLPLQEAGSGGALAIISAYFRWGTSRPIGGAGSFTGALKACVEAHGGEVRTDAPVGRILVRDGTTYGVALRSGEEILADHVVGAIAPTTLIRDLVEPEFIPRDVQDEIRAMRVLGWNIAPMKLDAALSGLPKLACGRDELWNGLLLIAPTIETVRRAQLACMRGELPTDLMLSPTMPSVLDRSLVPPGSDGHTLYTYLPTVPCEIEGKEWGDVRQQVGEDILDALEAYAPGLKSNVIGSYVKSPRELGEEVYRGNLYHVDIGLNQMGPWRPTPSLSGYRTPVQGLWHTAAGAHPMGALNGWSGRTTARLVNRTIGQQTRSSA